MRATLERGWKMRKVTVKKSELLEKVLANRALHIKEYSEACDGYRVKALEKIDEVFGGLKAKIGELKEGQTIALLSVTFGLDVPQTHEKDYDQVLEMLRMSTDDTTELQSDEFACYVMDDWDWKQEFTMSNRRYR